MGGRGYGGVGRGRVYTYRYIVTTRMMTCIKMGSDESHFNVSLIVRDKVTRQCLQTTTKVHALALYIQAIHPAVDIPDEGGGGGGGGGGGDGRGGGRVG